MAASPPPTERSIASSPTDTTPLLTERDKHEGAKDLKPEVTGMLARLHFRAAARSVNSTSDKFNSAEPVNYKIGSLSTWGILLDVQGSVWMRSSLWLAGLKMSMVSLCVGLLAMAVCQDPSNLKLDKLQKLSTFLNVFVGLLLGFFISSSMTRWYNAADGFMELFDHIRSLMMDLTALGVDEPKVDAIIRYGVLSGWMLNMELHVEAAEDSQKSAMNDEMWHTLTHRRHNQKFGHLRAEEVRSLKQVGDPAATIWVWVACMVGRLAADGDVPPMASPTYGRLQAQIHGAHKGIRDVRSSVSIQPPYIYVQMLATLVHLNNIINAITFGLTLGLAISMILTDLGYSIHGVKSSKVSRGEIAEDAQNLLVCFFVSVFAPFIYHGLLEVSVAVARPFSSKDGAVPTTKLLTGLEEDLIDAKRVRDALPGPWQQAHFKKPAGP